MDGVGGDCLSILWELEIFFFEDIHEGWDGRRRHEADL